MLQEREEAEEELRAEEERKPSRDRVRQMIAAAHRDASFSNSDEGDEVMQRGPLRESKTISEEMAKLASEEDRSVLYFYLYITYSGCSKTGCPKSGRKQVWISDTILRLKTELAQ